MPDGAAPPRPGWGWAIGSATLVVGFVAFFFPVAPFWAIVWWSALTALLGHTALGHRWVITERSGLLSEMAAHPWIARHPRLVTGAMFAAPALLVPGIVWDLSDAGQRWNGGALWAVAVFGFLARTGVEALRAAGHRARWWPLWVVLAVTIGGFVVVGGPARVRWAGCESALTAAVRTPARDDGDGVLEANDLDLSAGTTRAWCWRDARVRIVDGEVRLYTAVGQATRSGVDAPGEGLAYSPSGNILAAGGISRLVPLGDDWYWFETGTPLRNFWFDG